MARIETYETDSVVSVDDKLIGTDNEGSDATKNYTVGDILDLGVNRGITKLIAPNGSVYLLEVDNSGVLSTSLVV